MDSTPETSADHTAISEIRNAWVAAVSAGNADALADFLTDDYAVWANAAPSIRGPATAVAAMRGALERMHVEQRFEPAETIIAGDWAFERGVESVTVTPRSGGAPQTMSQRALLILRRGTDGKWRYARGM